jgi:hypothetical protein
MNLFEVHTELMRRGFHMYSFHLANGHVDPFEDLTHFKETLNSDFCPVRRPPTLNPVLGVIETIPMKLTTVLECSLNVPYICPEWSSLNVA